MAKDNNQVQEVTEKDQQVQQQGGSVVLDNQEEIEKLAQQQVDNKENVIDQQQSMTSSVIVDQQQVGSIIGQNNLFEESKQADPMMQTTIQTYGNFKQESSDQGILQQVSDDLTNNFNQKLNLVASDEEGTITTQKIVSLPTQQQEQQVEGLGNDSLQNQHNSDQVENN